jgi:hypothetical protein
MKSFTRFYGGVSIPDPDAEAYLLAAGITDNAMKAATNTLVKTLKLADVWDDLESAHPLLADKTNQLTYTEDYSNAAWGKAAVTVASVVQNTPVGTATCYNVIPTAVSAWHYLSRSLPLTLYGDGYYTISVYAKANGYDWLRFVVEDGIGNFARAWFNVNTGVLGTYGTSFAMNQINVAITPASDGFYRISFAYQYNGRPLLLWTSPSSADAQSGQWTGDGVSGVLVIGHQLEYSTTPTTYESVTASLMAPQMKYNLKNPLDTDAAHRIVWNNTATGFTRKGYTGVLAINNWGDIKLAPATYLLQDDVHLSMTSAVDYGLTATYIDFGLVDASGGVPSFHITPGFSTQGMRCRVNSANPTVLQFNSSTMGTFMANRVNATEIELYVDGALVDTETISSTGLSALSMYVGAINQNGAASVNSPRRLTFITTGKGLTVAKAAYLKSAITTFNNSIGR